VLLLPPLSIPPARTLSRGPWREIGSRRPILAATAMAISELQEDEGIHNFADPVPACIVSLSSYVDSSPSPTLASPGAVVYVSGAALRSAAGARCPHASVEGVSAPVRSMLASPLPFSAHDDSRPSSATGEGASPLPASAGSRRESGNPPYSGAQVPAFALSPAMKHFFPEVALADRAMVMRWMDYSDDEDEDEDFNKVVTREVGSASLTSYLDAVRRSSGTPALVQVLCSIVVQPPRGEGGIATTTAACSRTSRGGARSSLLLCRQPQCVQRSRMSTAAAAHGSPRGGVVGRRSSSSPPASRPR
jgi:hypothetical protein